MLKNKYFWIALVILVPFIIIWITEGLAWAVGTYVAIAVLTIMILGSTRRRRRRTYYHYDDDDDDGGSRDIYIHRRTVPCDNCGGTGRVPSLYIPRASVKCRACDGTGYLYD